MKRLLLIEIDDETHPEVYKATFKAPPPGVGIVLDEVQDPERYSRWFDEESSTNWNNPKFEEYNWIFLRTQQNWANDLLRAKGWLSLNQVYEMIGLARSPIGQLVGWTYDRDNKDFVDFGCWDEAAQPVSEEHPGGIFLNFNVGSVILAQIK